MSKADRYNPVEGLCNAIIIRAADDYRKALRDLKANPRNQAAIQMRDEVERFMRSKWYAVLTDVDGEFLLRKLKEEVK
ncbi:MAG: hypothetical protein LUC41_06050 [Clostridiales bacterium]|nr:hypothetical protein [Clostridiales bacterium]